MLKIKLTRIGKKGQPQYHVVVIEDRIKLNTRHIARLGYYNPLTTPHEFRLDRVSYDSWVVKGARPTDTIHQLVLKSTKLSK